MMFFGGITLALAVEYCKLHERIALIVILRAGRLSCVLENFIYKYKFRVHLIDIAVFS